VPSRRTTPGTVIGVVRGFRLFKDPVTGTLYRTNGTINFDTRGKNALDTWKLYDAIAAPAVVQSPPRSPDFDPPQSHADAYGVGGTQAGDGFYWDNFNRRTMVYLPTNGGMLHGFDGETGDEVFAYVPDDVMGLAVGEVAGSRDLSPSSWSWWSRRTTNPEPSVHDVGRALGQDAFTSLRLWRR
jgi:hypothetical protein